MNLESHIEAEQELFIDKKVEVTEYYDFGSNSIKAGNVIVSNGNGMVSWASTCDANYTISIDPSYYNDCISTYSWSV